MRAYARVQKAGVSALTFLGEEGAISDPSA